MGLSAIINSIKKALTPTGPIYADGLTHFIDLIEKYGFQSVKAKPVMVKHEKDYITGPCWGAWHRVEHYVEISSEATPGKRQVICEMVYDDEYKNPNAATEHLNETSDEGLCTLLMAEGSLRRVKARLPDVETKLYHADPNGQQFQRQDYEELGKNIAVKKLNLSLDFDLSTLNPEPQKN